MANTSSKILQTVVNNPSIILYIVVLAPTILAAFLLAQSAGIIPSVQHSNNLLLIQNQKLMLTLAKGQEDTVYLNRLTCITQLPENQQHLCLQKGMEKDRGIILRGLVNNRK